MKVCNFPTFKNIALDRKWLLLVFNLSLCVWSVTIRHVIPVDKEYSNLKNNVPQYEFLKCNICILNIFKYIYSVYYNINSI